MINFISNAWQDENVVLDRFIHSLKRLEYQVVVNEYENEHMVTVTHLKSNREQLFTINKKKPVLEYFEKYRRSDGPGQGYPMVDSYPNDDSPLTFFIQIHGEYGEYPPYHETFEMVKAVLEDNRNLFLRIDLGLWVDLNGLLKIGESYNTSEMWFNQPGTDLTKHAINVEFTNEL